MFQCYWKDWNSRVATHHGSLAKSRTELMSARNLISIWIKFLYFIPLYFKISNVWLFKQIFTFQINSICLPYPLSIRRNIICLNNCAHPVPEKYKTLNWKSIVAIWLKKYLVMLGIKRYIRWIFWHLVAYFSC